MSKVAMSEEGTGLAGGAGDDFYDYIVVGSGPGSAGFIHELLNRQPEASVLWFEEGERIGDNGDGLVAWPDALGPQIRKGNVPNHRFTKRHWLRARSWKGFGGEPITLNPCPIPTIYPNLCNLNSGYNSARISGGDALNSGGPNQIGLLKAENSDQRRVWKLRNQNIQPDGTTDAFGQTPLGDRFIDAFTEDAGGPVRFPTDVPDELRPGSGFVGFYPSSIYPNPMGRRFLAEKLYARFSPGPDRLSLRLGTKIVRLEVEETPTGPRVIGVVAQPQYGGEVAYHAGKVILAAGIFGTFSLLVDSGIGPPEALDTRGVATADRHIENFHIGRNVGDEMFVTCLFVAAKDQGRPPPQGRVAPLVGARAVDNRTQLVVWPRGLPTILALISKLQLLLRLLLTPFAKHWSYLSVSLDSKPNMTLKATTDSVEIDDSNVTFTPDMMAQYNSAIPALKKFLCRNQKAPQSFWRRWHRFWLRILTPIIHNRVIGPLIGMPPGVDEFNLEVKQDAAAYKQLATYNHFYGGAQPIKVLNSNFELYQTPPSPNKTEAENLRRDAMKGLHIADASVIPALTPGGPTASVMEMGVRVAERVCGETLP